MRCLSCFVVSCASIVASHSSAGFAGLAQGVGAYQHVDGLLNQFTCY